MNLLGHFFSALTSSVWPWSSLVLSLIRTIQLLSIVGFRPWLSLDYSLMHLAELEDYFKGILKYVIKSNFFFCRALNKALESILFCHFLDFLISHYLIKTMTFAFTLNFFLKLLPQIKLCSN